jgi:type II secretory pathway component PulM
VIKEAVDDPRPLHVSPFMTPRFLEPKLLLLAVTAWLGLWSPCLAFAITQSTVILTGERKRETLRDLTGVEVVVEQIPADAERDGLSTSQLKKYVESQLGGAGIRVLTHEERRTQPGHAYLYVSINTVKTRSIYSYAIELSLNQTVRLTRHPTIATFAPTWSAQVAGTTTAEHLDTIREDVSDFVQAFINDYLAMNPREETVLR